MIAFFIIFTIAVSVVLSNAREIRQFKRGLTNGVVWNFLERSQPPCHKIAYFFMNTSYLLYDKHLERQVVNMWNPMENLAEIQRKLYTNGFRIIAIGPITAPSSLLYPLVNLRVHMSEFWENTSNKKPSCFAYSKACVPHDTHDISQAWERSFRSGYGRP
jgi:hypothetical protein